MNRKRYKFKSLVVMATDYVYSLKGFIKSVIFNEVKMRPAQQSSVENSCCCALRLIGIILLIAFFFHLRQLQVQIFHQLQVNEDTTLRNLARIEEIERGLSIILQSSGQNRTCRCKYKAVGGDQNRGDDCKTKVFDAVKQYYLEDEVGQADYALESAGGRVLGVYDTENLMEPKTYFWSPICDSSHGPREIINPGLLPGQCWAFKGSHGAVLVQLTTKIRITSVSVQHVSKAISHVNDIKSAPRDFSIWGLTSKDDKGENLGNFVYDAEGPALQVFNVSSSRAYDKIKFVVASNHGNPRFTCVYRLRVHGIRACDK